MVPVDSYLLILLAIGGLLLLVTSGSAWIARQPLSYALIYLVVGILLGRYGFNLLHLRPGADFLERLTEFVVLVSLFNCGLKMNRPLKAWAWNSTIRLIGLLMPLSILAIAAVGHWLFQLDWGASVLLGAILAPTDPVLASEVQLYSLDDRNELRFGLTSEGGLNDALAFPFVYFGLHWLKNPNWQEWFGQWVVVDLVWAIAIGVVMGVLVAKAIGWVERSLKRSAAADESMEDFIALSTILTTYSLTELVYGYGFLAVFVSGIVMQHRYLDPKTSASRLRFMSQAERLLEIAAILILGSLLIIEPLLRFAAPALVLASLLLFVIRPLAVWISTIGLPVHPATRWLFGWFGIRGVGSLYYLNYSLGEGLKDQTGEFIAWVTIAIVVLSVVLHGTSATPLMRWYERRVEAKCPTDTEKSVE